MRAAATHAELRGNRLYTVVESKGMEARDVLLYNFWSDSPAQTECECIYVYVYVYMHEYIGLASAGGV